MSQSSSTRLLDFVEKFLVVDGAKCYRHCQRPTKFVPIFREEDSLVGAYACPESYVSRVVYFADHHDLTWFRKFLEEQVGSGMFRERDIRLATRHGWELGGKAESEIKRVSDSGTIRQYYWTFYAKSEEEKAFGAFICESCGRLFSKKISDPSKLCPKCALVLE